MVKTKGCNSVWTVTFLLLCCWAECGVTCPSMCKCSNVLYVYCDHANITDLALPSMLNQLSPETTYIDLSFNHLTSISGNVFGNFAELTSIDISHNEISSLSEFSFDSLPNLQKIAAMNNKIFALHNRTFANLPKLKEVDLSRNKISAIDACAFSSTYNLEKFVIRGNVLPDVTTGTLLSLVTLTYLDMSENDIRTIGDSAFSKLVNLRTLKMSNNKINRLELLSLSGLSKLEHLNLDANMLQNLDRYSLEPFRNTLKTFSCKRNKLTAIQSDVFNNCRLLREILLTENEISVIGIRAFAGLSLDRLDLKGNKLPDVTSSMFSSCYKIGHLDLSENGILNIGAHSFDSFKESIYRIDLQYNVLNRVLKGMFNGLKFLQALNLANNSISFIEDGVFSDLVNLKRLDLSWNRLSVVSSAVFQGLNTLTHLHLHYNPLMRFEYPENSGNNNVQNILMNLTVTEVTYKSAVIRWPYKEGSQIYWSRFVTCVRTSNCAFRPQPEFLAPYETELKLTDLASDSIYYVCIDPAFRSNNVRMHQCTYIRTNAITVITTVPLQTPMESPVSSTAAFPLCAISNLFLFICLTVVNVVDSN